MGKIVINGFKHMAGANCQLSSLRKVLAYNPNIMKYSELRAARGSKFAPFPAKNKLVELVIPKKIKPLEDVIPAAIKDNLNFMANPPIKNMGLSGFQKWRTMLPAWAKDFNDEDLLYGLVMSFIFLETGGTGGAMFRILYKDFLKEAGKLLQNDGLLKASEQFEKIMEQIRVVGKLLLPDDLPNMKKLREIHLKTNKISEKSEKDYQKQLKNLKTEEDKVIEGAKAETDDWRDNMSDLDAAIKKWAELEQSAWITIK